MGAIIPEHNTTFLLSLERFSVAGFDDEGMEYTQPVQITCAACHLTSPGMTYRDDGGADYTTPLSNLVKWVQEHKCLRTVGE
jgi:hypothetical protein